MNEKMKFGDKISGEILKSMSENLSNLIVSGILTCFAIIVAVLILSFIFSKSKNPISIKIPLIIALVGGLVFTGGFIYAAMLPIYLNIVKWNEFMTGISIL